MKQLIRFSLLLLAFLLPATAAAYDFEVDGIYYNINNSNEATVTYKDYNSNCYSGDIRFRGCLYSYFLCISEFMFLCLFI